MDEKLIHQIQREGAEALLDAGVSLPLKDIRLPFMKTPLRLRLTMKRPTMERQIKIAQTYLSMETKLKEFTSLDYNGQMVFLTKHG